MVDVIARFAELNAQQPELKLYVLIDGLAYEAHTGERLSSIPGVNRALFDGTPDEALAYAGPWLFQADQVEDQWSALLAFEAVQPAVSWLIASLDMEGLAQVLQLRLNLTLPSGQTALLRLSDPRVLSNLFSIMTPEQKTAFFYLIEEWHFIQNGQRVRARHTDA
jgi:hypothetical protein